MVQNGQKWTLFDPFFDPFLDHFLTTFGPKSDLNMFKTGPDLFKKGSRDGPKTVTFLTPKWSKKWSKNGPQIPGKQCRNGVKKGSKNDPKKWSKSGPKTVKKGSKKGHFVPISVLDGGAQKGPFLTLFGPFWTPFLTPFWPLWALVAITGGFGLRLGGLFPGTARTGPDPSKRGLKMAPKRGHFRALPALAHMGPSGPALARDPSSGRTN